MHPIAAAAHHTHPVVAAAPLFSRQQQTGRTLGGGGKTQTSRTLVVRGLSPKRTTPKALIPTTTHSLSEAVEPPKQTPLRGVVGWHGKRRGGGDSRVLARGRAVWESEYGDTVGRSGRRRETLLFSAVNARRKTFSAAADMWWPEVVVARQNMTSRMAAVGGGP
ncbi:hypothetical protein Tco_0769497 [Tanacetum coccineum]|uniref:Uncharacterized protein n=1 Tax=Tanacetum coccineum TaxID=301880 RepID=A0ABQ4ZBD7_9ASTR